MCSGSSSKSSSTGSMSSSASSDVNPKASMSISEIASNSISNFAKSQTDNSATLLSAIRNALSCCSVKSSAMMHGTDSRPSFLAARSLVCPAMITFSLSIMIGTLNPNSLIDAATASTASSLILGLFAYGINSSICFSMICNFKLLFRGRRFCDLRL